VVDHAGEMALEGGTADIGRLVNAVETLTKLLPKTVEPQSHRADPRVALLALIMEQRARAGVPSEGVTRSTIRALTAENAELRARLGDAPERSDLPDHLSQKGHLQSASARTAVITPSAGDVTPPGERADRDPGMRPGPDDKSPVTIDADAIDIRRGYNDTPEPWRQFCTDTDGVPLTGRGRRY
jgi:hypothetical protein